MKGYEGKEIKGGKEKEKKGKWENKKLVCV